MPANWANTPEKEKAWNRAKEIFKDQYDKDPDSDKDYAIVMSIAKNIYQNEEIKGMKNGNIIEVQEEVQIGDYLLEKGDKVKVLTEESIVFGEFDIMRNPNLVDAVSKHIGQRARVYHIYDNDIGLRVISNGTFNIRRGDIMVQREELDYFIIESDKIDMVDYRVDNGEYFIEVYMQDGFRVPIHFFER